MNQFIPVVNHSLKYNPSLDGIRGVAILLVMLFHIWPEYFAFGYLGVDIFFVLSGYLITQIIQMKLQSNLFSFKEFYRNRIRRIFPTVIIVLLVSLLIGYLFLFPLELENLGKHIKSSAFFYQNFRLIGEVGYWDEAAQLKPLLHFWSLSIEEQFYLFWPFVVFIIYKLRLNLLVFLFVLFLISFIFPYILEIDNFYHSLARFWELILGGLIYALSIKYTVQISKDNKFFSFYPLVFLGLISFPLYLWHYVFISYMHIFGLNVQEYGFLIILVTIVLSYLTYRYIEIYARKQTSYKFIFLLLALLIFIGLVGKYIYKQDGLPNRAHLISNDKFQKQFIRTPAKNKKGILLTTKILGYKPSNDYIKSTSDDVTKKYIALIGDSHAHTSYPGFAREFKKKGFETILLANSGCSPIYDGASGRTLSNAKQCKEKIDNIYNLISRIKNIEKIIFISRGIKLLNQIGFGIVDDGLKSTNVHFMDYYISQNTYNHKSIFFARKEKTFQHFNELGIDFYYLLENPELGFSPKNCMIRPFDIFPSDCRLDYKDYIERAGEYRNYIYKLSKKYENITILDPKDLYCDDNYCYAIKDNIMLYADDDHHSVDGSIIQAKYFIKKIFNDK